MREVLEKVKQGEISVEEAEHYFRKAPFDEMGYAKLDMHRKFLKINIEKKKIKKTKKLKKQMLKLLQISM